MGTITFEVHPITPTSSRNMLLIILKAFWSFCFYSLHIFLFEHSMHRHIRERERERERERIPNYVCLTSQFCYTKAHRYYKWLAGFSGKMVIYAFLLGFLVLPIKKRVIWVWDISDNLNHTHYKHKPQSSLT